MATQQVSYREMKDMTADDWRLLDAAAAEDMKAYPDRLLAAVAGLGSYQGASLVNRLEHSLQSATRAYRDGKESDYVSAALLHDIGDELAPYSHGAMVGAIVRPYLGERLAWIIDKHPVFQLYYYGQVSGADPNARERYKDHPYYEDCVEFCEKYDQNCFDPDYDSLPLEFFEPTTRAIFGKPPAHLAW